MEYLLKIQRTTSTKLAAVGLPLLIGASGTAAAHSGGSGLGGGIMGGWGGLGGIGMFGGGMLLWPLLIGLILLVVFGTGRWKQTDRTDNSLAELRERYARGELSDEEFESRRASLIR